MQLRIGLLLGVIFLTSSGFTRVDCLSQETSVEVITFVVEPGRTVLVKGDFLIESDAILDIQGTLVVEGAMLVNKGLSLAISGEGKLLVKGGLKNQSVSPKSITVKDNGVLSIDGTWETNENIKIITAGMGLIKANKVIAGENSSLSGTGNLVASDCHCEQVSKKSELTICQLLALAKT